jgi:spore maturation protein CgeB
MPLPEAQLRAIREYDPADVYFGEREEDCMIDFTKATGKRYVLIPNAADRLLHFPTPPADEYAFDVVFLGNRRTNKSQIFEDFLIPLCRDRRYRIGLFGPFWTKRDFVFAAAQKALYQIGLHRASKVVSDFRIAVPFDKENVLYSSAKICLNFHERESDGTQPHHVVNMRAFKIAACGGFQLCDRVHAMPRYFEEDKEIVMANDASEFRSKMDYFIRKDDMRRQISLRAAERAHRDHTYHNRVDLLIDILQGKHRLAGVPVLRA